MVCLYPCSPLVCLVLTPHAETTRAVFPLFPATWQSPEACDMHALLRRRESGEEMHESLLITCPLLARPWTHSARQWHHQLSLGRLRHMTVSGIRHMGGCVCSVSWRLVTHVVLCYHLIVAYVSTSHEEAVPSQQCIHLLCRPAPSRLIFCGSEGAGIQSRHQACAVTASISQTRQPSEESKWSHCPEFVPDDDAPLHKMCSLKRS